MKLNGAEITIRLLERQGIHTIAGIPGGTNLPLYNALYKSKIRHILARHEQGAAFIAQGMARSTGRPAVCFATSGPGATNLMTAIADAKMDSVPIIAITGQVATSLIGTDAFQEVDTYGMSIPITKHNFLVKSAGELLKVIPDAFRIAMSGRPGPVLIDIPKDVQLAVMEVDEWPDKAEKSALPVFEMEEIRKIAEAVDRSKKPLLYIGGGIIQSGAAEELSAFAAKGNIPVASTLMGFGSMTAENPLYIGMLGMHAARFTNMILEEADLLLVFGARFDDRATGKISQFSSKAEIVHVDIDHAEIHKLKQADIHLTADAKEVLKALTPLVSSNPREGWLSDISRIKKEFPFIGPGVQKPMHPIQLIKAIQAIAPEDSIFSTDVGQHQMWSAQALNIKRPRTFLTSGGLGTMGFGLPAAIGASLANPGRRLICLSGDGSIMMNIQELATLAEWDLPVCVIVFNNGHLGLVRQQQELFFEGNYIACRYDKNPDLKMIAAGFGITAFEIAHPEEIQPVLLKAMSLKGPAFINIVTDPRENVYPMVPPGATNMEMIGGNE